MALVDSKGMLAPARAFGPVVVCALSAIASALWIAICAAAPEFIWQGLRLVSDHVGQTELLSAMLIGVVLAFFVEPGMERLRLRLHGVTAHDKPHGKPRTALFTVAVSVAFAFASVCVHDAITAFVSGRDAPAGHGGLEAGIRLAVEWAFVPFAITLAWLTVWPAWLRVAMGVFAALSSALAAWIFGWGVPSGLTTTIPCVAILAIGYVQLGNSPHLLGFARCARAVAIVAAVWLLVGVLIQALSVRYGSGSIELYPESSLWEDFRFYVGWAIGLTLAPWPFAEREA